MRNYNDIVRLIIYYVVGLIILVLVNLFTQFLIFPQRRAIVFLFLAPVLIALIFYTPEYLARRRVRKEHEQRLEAISAASKTAISRSSIISRLSPHKASLLNTVRNLEEALSEARCLLYVVDDDAQAARCFAATSAVIDEEIEQIITKSDDPIGLAWRNRTGTFRDWTAGSEDYWETNMNPKTLTVLNTWGAKSTYAHPIYRDGIETNNIVALLVVESKQTAHAAGFRDQDSTVSNLIRLTAKHCGIMIEIVLNPHFGALLERQSGGPHIFSIGGKVSIFDQRDQEVHGPQSNYGAGRDINFGDIQSRTWYVTELEKLLPLLAEIPNQHADQRQSAEQNLREAIAEANKPDADKSRLRQLLSSARNVLTTVAAAATIVNAITKVIELLGR